ncbi:hypothetical protein CBR_g46683 [Chara braunii]|uniref:Uncharacterized protein n=1 Tax=Chara braunii TaxID=69332 RepID=A0A388M107_CHABU|nr:hypothetical protein CBR_g46683 [Chara braunii]|eukprot:GBG88195.1 hypothetical protein CBR_g46683 [Chara braunii]
MVLSSGGSGSDQERLEVAEQGNEWKLLQSSSVNDDHCDNEVVDNDVLDSDFPSSCLLRCALNVDKAGKSGANVAEKGRMILTMTDVGTRTMNGLLLVCMQE